MSTKPLALLALAAVLTGVAGCGGSNVQAGIPNRWRADQASFVVGRTTVDDVLGRLGPPSQIVPLREGSIYYYVLQETSTSTINAIVYESTDTDVVYDRALFHFDAKDVLVRVSMSPNVIDYDAP